MKNTNVFRYVALNLDLNQAYELETDKLYKIGQKTEIWDSADRKTYAMRILRIEGTVYNKSAQELAEAKRKEEAIA